MKTYYAQFENIEAKIEKISTEYLSTFKDFEDIEEFYEYLETVPWVDSDYESLSDRVRYAILQEKSYIVEPVGEFDDITIDFTYKDDPKPLL